MSARRRRYPWIRQGVALLVLLAAAAAGVLLLQAYLQDRPVDLLPATEAMAIEFERVLEQNLVPAEAIRLRSRRSAQDEAAAWNIYHYEVEIPPTVSMEGLIRLLRTRLGPKVVVHDIPESHTQVALSLLLRDHEFVIARLHTQLPPSLDTAESGHAAPPPVPPEQGILSPMPPSLQFLFEEHGAQVPLAAPWAKLAIILDDGGYGGDVTEAVLQLDSRLTLAILPHAPEGPAIASRAAALGFEVMLHMPMEPHDAAELYEGSVTTEMSPEEIAAVFREALADVPHAVGVNNHTGSKFCEDAAALGALLEAVKERNLYFVDSRTTSESLVLDVARRVQAPAAARDVFLDHENTRPAILEQWAMLVEICRAQGAAIGIGHFRPLTVGILEEKLAELAGLGIELVHASEVVRLVQALEE